MATSRLYLASAQYLAQLATAQTESATAIGAAETQTAGLDISVTSTHGTTCQGFTGPFADALSARTGANKALQAACTALADKLNEAASQYASTDESSSDNLDAAGDGVANTPV